MAASAITLVNLIPFPVIIGSQNSEGTFQKTRTVPNESTSAKVAEHVLGNEIIEIRHGECTCKVNAKTISLQEIIDLPAPTPGVYYIVSMAVAKRVHELGISRTDLLGPYSEKAIYVNGRIAGVPGLVRYEFSNTPPKEGSVEQKTAPVYNTAINLSYQPMVFGKRNEEGSFDSLLTIPKAAESATIESEAVRCGEIDGIPLFSMKLKGVKNLPEPEEGTIFLTTMPVAQDSGRSDVYAGDFSTVIRVDGVATTNFTGIVRYVSSSLASAEKCVSTASSSTDKALSVVTNPYAKQLIGELPNLKRVVNALKIALEPVVDVYRPLVWQEFSKQLAELCDMHTPQPFYYILIQNIQNRELDNAEKKLVKQVNVLESLKYFREKFLQSDSDQSYIEQINTCNNGELVSLNAILCTLLHLDKSNPNGKTLEETLIFHMKDYWKVICEDLQKIEIRLFNA